MASRFVTNWTLSLDDLARWIVGRTYQWRVPWRFAEDPDKAAVPGRDAGILLFEGGAP
jgi:hypothetical protein